MESIDEGATARLSGAIGRWDQGATCLAALAVAADPGAATGPLTAAAREVMTAAGLSEVLACPERLPFTPAQLTGMATSPLLQATALVDGHHRGWTLQSARR
jgi:hypothetical protein